MAFSPKNLEISADSREYLRPIPSATYPPFTKGTHYPPPPRRVQHTTADDTLQQTAAHRYTPHYMTPLYTLRDQNTPQHCTALHGLPST